MSMNELETEGIVIASREYRERDLLVTLLTPSGRHALHARGTLKVDSRNAGALQLGTRGIYQLHSGRAGGLFSLRQAAIKDSYPAIRRTLLGTAMMLVLCEIMASAQDDPRCFLLLKQTLDDMERTQDLYTAPCVCVGRMCALAGIAPMTEGCVRCGHQDEICALSLRQGGFLCRRCAEQAHAPRLDKAALRRFRLIMHAGMDSLDILRAHARCGEEDFMRIFAFYREYSGSVIRGADFLQTAAAMERKKH